VSSPRVTVAIPVYNVQDYVAETLDSLLAQTYTDYEAIIVNDGSTDDSAKVIEPYLKDKRLKYIYQENKGLGAARNTALELARGEWFAQLDSDDIWLPEKLEKQLALADSDPKANLIYGNAIFFFPDGRERLSYEIAEMREGDITEWLYEDNHLVGTTLLIKTDDLRAVGGYDVRRLGEDYDTWLRMVQRYLYVRAVKEPLIRYRIRVGSLVSNGLENRTRQIEIMSEALGRETRPVYAAKLASGIRRQESLKYYEEALIAAQFGSPDVGKLLYESWRKCPDDPKKALIVLGYYCGGIPGLGCARRIIINRLKDIMKKRGRAA